MQNRICLITGASSGIGKATAMALARQGMDLILVNRHSKRAEEARKEILEVSRTKRVDLVHCDLSEPDSVEQAAKHIHAGYEKLDVLLNNAGILSNQYQTNSEGVELTFATNHLGPFLLTNLLLHKLRKGRTPRIVTVSSEAHRWGRFDLNNLIKPARYNQISAYALSKTANILFANRLAAQLQPEGITSNSLHPGGVKTHFGDDSKGLFMTLMRVFRPFMLTPEQGAETSIYLAAAPEAAAFTGRYFDRKKPKSPARDATSTYYGEQLWALSEKLTRLENRKFSF